MLRFSLFLGFLPIFSSERVFHCDFEADWCGAEDIPGDFLLSESNTDTPTHGTGPQFGDHTSGNGYFIFAECSWPRKEGDKAGIVVRNLLCSTGLGNVQGYLSRKGSDASAFRVTKRASSYGNFSIWNDDQTLGQIDVNRSVKEDWEFFNFDFENDPDENFEIVFEFTCNGHLGDIALDDIAVNCVDENKDILKDKEHSRLPARQIQEYEDGSEEASSCQNEQTRSLSCNFDDELLDSDECGWRVTGLTRWEGETFTPGTGPSAAQTGSHYVYLESSDLSQGSLESFSLQSGASICLTFAYHIRAHKKSSLEVIANDEVIWRSSGIWNEETNKWKKAQLDIYMKKTGKIKITAVAKSVQSDIAIDSIKVSGCPCNYDEDKQSVLNCNFEEEKSTCGFTPSSFIKLRKGILVNPFGKLTSAKNDDSGCLNIVYRSTQDKMKLAAYDNSSRKNRLVWETTQNTRGAWVKESFNVGKHGLTIKNEPLDLSNLFATGYEIQSTSFNFLPCPEKAECNFESDFCNLEYSEAEDKELMQIDFYGKTKKGVHLEYGESIEGKNPWRVGCLKVWNSARGVIYIHSQGRRHKSTPSFSRPWQLIQTTLYAGSYQIKAEDYSLISSVSLHSGPCLPCCQNDGIGQLWSKCRNGQCIASDDLCDGFDDCGDGSDEADDICDRSKNQCGVSELILDQMASSSAKSWEELLNLPGLGGEEGPRLKLAGGHIGRKSQFPWLALIYIFYKGEQKVCGGGILDNKWIITAAHCVQKYDSMEIVLGEHDRLQDERNEQKFQQDIVVTHEYYEHRSGRSPKNDIALIRLNDDIIFDENVLPICWDTGFNVGFTGDDCAIAGWGYTENAIDNSVIQRYGAMQILEKTDCQERWNGTEIPENTICAGERYQVSACRGDSGGPLVCKGPDERWHLRGIVSFGRGKCSTRSPLPTVFTDIPKFKRWISQSIRDNASC